MTKINYTLTNGKLLAGIAAPLIGVLFFFFSLSTDIEANAKDIQENKQSIDKLVDKLDDMNNVMVKVQSNQAVLINQMNTITKGIERIEKRMEEK